MPVFSDRKVSTRGVRSRGRGAVAGGGLGLGGLLLFLVINLLSGGEGFVMPDSMSVDGTGESPEQMQQRCNSDGALEKHDDCYLVKVYNEINEIWDESLNGYRQPFLSFFEGGVSTGCGNASSEVGPFYCPPDREIFIDIGFLETLQSEFGAEGRYAQAYIMAHEVGHHLQTINGTERQVREQQQRNPRRANELSVKLELQADCFAGVWGRLADEKGNVSITEAELDQALEAAAAIGDDRIQKKTQGRVDPESWTHGSSQQRRTWYLRGFREPRLEICNTF